MRFSSHLTAATSASLILFGCAGASGAPTALDLELAIEQTHRLTQGAGSSEISRIDQLRDERRLEEAGDRS